MCFGENDFVSLDTPIPGPRPPPSGEVLQTSTVYVYKASIGTSIGPYIVIRQLGEGGMGIVYQAQQLHPIRRDVALKVIKPGMDSKQVITRFESERQALALMDHPNIARVLDAGTTTTGLPYFVMELVNGVPITCYCDSKRLTIRERVELFIPVCQAIQHAHQKGIIHRDIKPSNILVMQLENRAVPKVIDFGLAKALGAQLSNATMMTNFGAVVGTFQYMSPEQADLGRHDIDTRSDIFSLGAVMYELLTGTTPLESDRFANGSYLEILQHIREEESRPPSVRLRRSSVLKSTAELRQSDPAKLPKLLDHDLDWIAMKALEKDRTRRYETVNAMVRDLQRYLDGEPVEAAPPSAAYRMGKFIRRHRAWLAGTAAFTALLLASVIATSWMAIRAGHAEQEAAAVNEFLRNDLLAQAGSSKQARPDTKPDPHLEVRTALDRAAARVEGRFPKQPLVEAAIQQTIGETYRDLGLYSEAQQHLVRALELHRPILGENHPKTLASMSGLASVFERSGKYAEAEPLLTRVIEAQRRVLGKEHQQTLESMTVLALIYYRQGKYAMAETVGSETLEAQRKVLGAEHPSTLRTANNLGVVFNVEGKFAESEGLYVKLLDVRRRVLGEEHPGTLQTMTNLAGLYELQGKYALAEQLHEKAATVRRRILGAEHPDTLLSMGNVAEIYVDEGRYTEAEGLLSTVLAVRSRVLTKEHPDTLYTMSTLGNLYESEGKYAKAASLLSEALEARSRILGKDHPRTLGTQVSLGSVRLKQKNFPAAESELREALNFYETAKLDGWERYLCQSMLGASLAGAKKYAGAEGLLTSSYQALIQRRARIPYPRRATLEEAGQRIVQLYKDWEKPGNAIEWGQRISEMNNLSGSPVNP